MSGEPAEQHPDSDAREKSTPGVVTALLRAWGSGDQSVEPRLLELSLPSLGSLRASLSHPNSLLEQAYRKLVDPGAHSPAAGSPAVESPKDRRLFFAFAAHAMRRFVQEDGALAQQIPAAELARAREISRLLDEIESREPDWVSVVGLKYYLSFTDEEAAEALGMPPRTVQRIFSDARCWLFQRLEPLQCQDLPPLETNTTN